MKMRLLLLLLAVGLLAGFGAGCRRGQPILPQTVDFTSETDRLTANDVRLSILEGCATRGWMAHEVSPGLIEAKVLVRGKHTVVVSIPYTDSSYTIRYKDSVNMEHKVKGDGTEVIHPNYARWVANLEQSINGVLSARRNKTYQQPGEAL